MNEDEVRSLQSRTCWRSNAALASCVITTTTGEVGTLDGRVLQAEPGAGLRARQELHRWYHPKSAGEGASPMARLIETPRSKTVAERQRAIMAWEHRVAEHEARRKETVQDTVKVAAMKIIMTAENA